MPVVVAGKLSQETFPLIARGLGKVLLSSKVRLRKPPKASRGSAFQTASMDLVNLEACSCLGYVHVPLVPILKGARLRHSAENLNWLFSLGRSNCGLKGAIISYAVAKRADTTAITMTWSVNPERPIIPHPGIPVKQDVTYYKTKYMRRASVQGKQRAG